LDGVRIWCRGIEIEGEDKNEEIGRKIFEVDAEGGFKNIRILNKRGVAKEEAER